MKRWTRIWHPGQQHRTLSCVCFSLNHHCSNKLNYNAIKHGSERRRSAAAARFRFSGVSSPASRSKTSDVKEKAMEQKKTGPQDKGRMGDKPGVDKGADRGLASKDTDGDGKVVKPGQKPGQSHGHGLDKK
jgi:hypothetical protein